MGGLTCQKVFNVFSKWNALIAKDCLLTLVKGRLALGSPGCSVIRLFVRHHAENGPIHRKMVVDYPIVITSKVKPKQQDQERGMNGPASLLHS